MDSEVTYYRKSEIREHNNLKSAWIIMDNLVYDITKFLEDVSNSLLNISSYFVSNFLFYLLFLASWW